MKSCLRYNKCVLDIDTSIKLERKYLSEKNESDLLIYWKLYFKLAYLFLVSPYKYSQDVSTGQYVIQTTKWRKVL